MVSTVPLQEKEGETEWSLLPLSRKREQYLSRGGPLFPPPAGCDIMLVMRVPPVGERLPLAMTRMAVPCPNALPPLRPPPPPPQEPKLAFEDVDAIELYPCVMFYSSNPGEKVRQSATGGRRGSSPSLFQAPVYLLEAQPPS